MFTYAGDLIPGARPILRNFTIGADVYQGQLAKIDEAASTGGEVIKLPVAAAGPDTAGHVLGLVTGVVTSPSYTQAYYQGDLATYDTSQATLIANDPQDLAKVQLTLLTPTTLIKSPLWHTAPGTAMEVHTVTTANAAGTSVITGNSHATVDGFSTIYCRTGANAGQYRRAEGTGTTTVTAVPAFRYGIAVGDTFVISNVVQGQAHLDLVATYVNALDGNAALSNYFLGYVHQLNLETAGGEYAVFTLNGQHLILGAAGV